MNAPRSIIDQLERELAAPDRGTPYIGAAAGGTGKTTRLGGRVMTIIRERQVSLAQVVAITFTEKAAGELKIKLRKRLEECAQKDSHHRPDYRRALLELDVMPVSTIHAFCGDLIRERPVEAGVEPNFTVADPATAELLRTEIWEQWIAQEFSADCAAARPLLERNIPVESDRSFSLHDVYELLLNYREDLDHLHVKCLDEDALLSDIAELRTGMYSDLSVLAGCTNPADSLAVELIKARAWLDALTVDRQSDLESVVRWLEARPTLDGRGKGKQAHWISTDVQEAAQRFRKDFAGRIEAVYAQVVSRWSRDLVEWMKGAVAAFAQAESQRGLLDFHDLLIVSRNMLRDNRAARQFFKERFAYVLVDEFQDTDPLQAEIAFYLAEQPQSFAANWEDAELVPGKLFIVGDPKQSIYRFRRADLDLYGKVRAKLETSGKCLNIRMNFRSRPDILSEVNEVFAAQMTGARNGRYEPEYVALEPFRGDDDHTLQTIILSPPDAWSSDTLKAKERAEAEAACIAEYIREQVAAGRLAYRDVGILYSATTYLSELEQALRGRDIPYQVAGGKKLIERSEIVALRTVIAALDNPFDEMSIVGALRSPFFACSDEDLLRQRLDGKGFNYTRVQGVLPHLEACFALMRELQEQKSALAPSALLAELFSRTKGLQIYVLKTQGESRVANLLKLLELARGLEAGGSASLHALAQRLARLEDSRAGEEDSVTSETGDDVVQLLTIYKAKGLEFPAVILYHLGKGRDPKDKAIISKHTKAIEFSVHAGFATAGYKAAQADERDRETCEDLRLLYVAMTRAREQLVIPAYWGDASKGFYEFLRKRFPAESKGQPRLGESRFRMHDTGRYSLDTASAETLRLDVEMPETDRRVQASLARKAEWEAVRAQALQRLQRTEAFAAPSRAHAASAVTEAIRTDDNRALAFGNFVHRLMEFVTLPEGENLERVAGLAASEFGINEDQRANGCTLVRGALRSELFGRVARAKAVYREVPFTDVQDGVIWEGAIDLLFVEDSGIVVVDFKTDQVTAESCRQYADVYHGQMSAYRRAIKKISAKPVTSVLLYFLRPNVVVSCEEEIVTTV